MWRKRTGLVLPLLLAASVLTTPACSPATRPNIAPPPPTDGDSGAPSIVCTAFRVIRFAQLPQGAIDDPGNVADRDRTVEQILEHNAKWLALCTNPLTPPAL